MKLSEIWPKTGGGCFLGVWYERNGNCLGSPNYSSWVLIQSFIYQHQYNLLKNIDTVFPSVKLHCSKSVLCTVTREYDKVLNRLRCLG